MGMFEGSISTTFKHGIPSKACDFFWISADPETWAHSSNDSWQSSRSFVQRGLFFWIIKIPKKLLTVTAERHYEKLHFVGERTSWIGCNSLGYAVPSHPSHPSTRRFASSSTRSVHRIAEGRRGGTHFFPKVSRGQWMLMIRLAVSNIFYVHPYLGKIPILTNIFQMGWSRQIVKEYQWCTLRHVETFQILLF